MNHHQSEAWIGVGELRYAPILRAARSRRYHGKGRDKDVNARTVERRTGNTPITFVERAHGSAEPFVIAEIDDGHGEARFGTSAEQRDDFAQDTALSDLKALARHSLIFNTNANVIFMLTPKASEHLPKTAQ